MGEFSNREYWPGTIEINTMPEGGRDLAQYERELMFRREDLAGKEILDLGTGPELRLSEGLKRAGIEAHVVSLSPDFSEQQHRDRARSSAPDNDIVAGLGQRLPFRDGSFDVILAGYVVQHLRNDKQLNDLILESARTLKSEGRAIIGPMYDRLQAEPIPNIVNDRALQKRLNRLQARLSIVLISSEVMPTLSIKTATDQRLRERVPAFTIVIEKNCLANNREIRPGYPQRFLH